MKKNKQWNGPFHDAVRGKRRSEAPCDCIREQDGDSINTLHEAEKSRVRSVILRARKEERRRISIDLHDTILQSLAALKINADFISKHCAEHRDQKLEKLAEMNVDLITNMLVELKRIIYGLRPTGLEKAGLIPTLRAYTDAVFKDSGIRFHFRGNRQTEKVDSDLANELFRLVQEAINNVVKHAEAKNVWLTVEHNPPKIVIVIQDNGKGFDLGGMRNRAKGLGLEGMAERVRVFNGRLSISSSPGKGSKIQIEMNTNA